MTELFSLVFNWFNHPTFVQLVKLSISWVFFVLMICEKEVRCKLVSFAYGNLLLCLAHLCSFVRNLC